MTYIVFIEMHEMNNDGEFVRSFGINDLAEYEGKNEADELIESIKDFVTKNNKRGGINE